MLVLTSLFEKILTGEELPEVPVVQSEMKHN